jgi:hypothetical protein
MKGRRIQIVLVFLISFSIPLFSAYFAYCDLTEAYFLSCDMCFENPGQDNLSFDRHDESKLFVPSVLSVRFPPGMDLSEQFLLFSFTTCSLDRKTFVLRC